MLGTESTSALYVSQNCNEVWLMKSCTYCWFSCKYTAVTHCSGGHSSSLSFSFPYSLLGHNSHWVLAMHNFCTLVVSRHSICSCFPFQDRWVLSTNCYYYDCENKWILNDVIALDQSFNFYEAFRIGLHTKRFTENKICLSWTCLQCYVSVDKWTVDHSQCSKCFEK